MKNSSLLCFCLALFCLLTSSLQAQKSDWQVKSFGIHLQFDHTLEDRKDRSYLIEHFRTEADQINLPEGEVRFQTVGTKSRLRSGANLSLERQLKSGAFAQLKMNLNYHPNANHSFFMDGQERVMLSQEGLGFSLDYRRVWKRGVFAFSAGIGGGGKWYLQPQMSIVTEMDSSEMADLISNIDFGVAGANVNTMGFRVDALGGDRLRARIDYHLYIPLGVAIQMTRRIQLELDARIGMNMQQILGAGFYNKSPASSFQFAYVFLL